MQPVKHQTANDKVSDKLVNKVEKLEADEDENSFNSWWRPQKRAKSEETLDFSLQPDEKRDSKLM